MKDDEKKYEQYCKSVKKDSLSRCKKMFACSKKHDNDQKMIIRSDSTWLIGWLLANLDDLSGDDVFIQDQFLHSHATQL